MYFDNKGKENNLNNDISHIRYQPFCDYRPIQCNLPMERFKMIEFLVTTAKLRVSKKEITYLQYLILSSVRKHFTMVIKCRKLGMFPLWRNCKSVLLTSSKNVRQHFNLKIRELIQVYVVSQYRGFRKH